MHTQILKRCGIVLISLQLIGVGALIWAIVEGGSYNATMDVLAIVAGVLVMKGSLKTARWVSVGITFFLTALGGCILVLAFLLPPGFWWAALRSTTLPGWPLLIGLAYVGVYVWVLRQTLTEPVLAAEKAAGLRPPRLKTAAAIGAAFAVTLMLFVGMALRGETAQEAIRRAHEQLGGDYQYVVTSLNMQSGANGKHAIAVVVVYNSSEFRPIRIAW